MSQIGLVIALPGELRTLGGARMRPGQILQLNSKTLVALSGIGLSQATRAAQLLIQKGSNALLSWGCAAALDAKLRPGDLVIPEQVLCADGSSFDTDRNWRCELIERLSSQPGIYRGAITESPTLVEQVAAKKALHERSRAIALDMESAATARVAASHRIPFVAIRAIADPADMALPAPVALSMDSEGTVNVLKLLGFVLRFPASIGAMVALSRSFRAAQERLRSTAAILEHDFRPHLH